MTERHVPPLMCATCRRELKVTENYDGQGNYTGYEVTHSVAIPGTPEHPIDPVVITEGDQLVEVCDFCSIGPDVPWVYPAEDFDDDLVVGPDGVPRAFKSIGDWGACEACHEDFRREDGFQRMLARQLDGMVKRGELSLEMLVSPALVQQKEANLRLWQGFMRHRLGPPYRSQQ